MLPLSVVIASLAISTSALASPSTICKKIGKQLSDASSVYYPGDVAYTIDLERFADSSETNSTCTVEPGSARDVGIVLGIVGSSRTEFGIKGGGHSLNPGFSSTRGVQIDMRRFNEIVYHKATQTVDVGPGLVWDDVYAALAQHKVNVVGARATGVGVAGFTLGGGYSYKTNQFGLAIDTVTAFELVLPTGKIKLVNSKHEPDLFFALRGGGNNFGIVTKFTFKTHPQVGDVWGGTITYPGNASNAVTKALVKYTSSVKDQKTGLQCTFANVLGQALILVNLFYDAPKPPRGIFDEFLSIPAVVADIKTRPFLEIIKSSNTDLSANLRGIYNTISHKKVTETLIRAVINETNVRGALLANSSLFLNGYVIEPFLPEAYKHSVISSAYPPDRSENVHPMNIYYAWKDDKFDDKFMATSRATAKHLTMIANAEGILGSAKYNNYAIAGTSIQELYGHHSGRLKAIKAYVDPKNVMHLTGGWKL